MKANAFITALPVEFSEGNYLTHCPQILIKPPAILIFSSQNTMIHKKQTK